MLEIQNAVCGYGKKEVIRGLSLSVGDGEIICILGANGIGKTTLFKSVMGHLKLISGEILLDGQNIDTLPRKTVAKSIGYVPQAHTPPFPFTVIDVVTMGRTAYLSAFASPSRHDVEIADAALATLNIEYLRDKVYTQISGGERQLVLIARALAQKPKMLIMDEPMANLDFGNQIRMLDRVKELASGGISVIYTTHFPDHAFLCSTKAAVIKNSSSFIIGKAEEVITKDLLHDIYNIDVDVMRVKLSEGTAVTCIPKSSA